MMKYLKILTLTLPLLALSAPTAQAWDNKPADDTVVFKLSAEDWVLTQTARVIVSVEAAVTKNTAGGMRKEMTKAVDGVVKAKWRLTNFRRNQDKTGMERWSATFEARLPEAVLSGLSEQAKKKSKAGMQIRIRNMDFSPTLAERQDVKSTLRSKIYNMAKAQLDELNKSITGRTYRIAMVDFTGRAPIQPRRNYRSKNREMMSISSDMGGAQSMEKSEKMVLSANIVLAAEPVKQAPIQ